MKQSKIAAVLLVLLAFIGAAQAQDIITTAGTHWEGFYFYMGGNIGGAWPNTCDTWEPGAAITSDTYANFELDNIHNSFTMNMFRVGFHYRFYSRRSASQEQL